MSLSNLLQPFTPMSPPVSQQNSAVTAQSPRNGTNGPSLNGSFRNSSGSSYYSPASSQFFDSFDTDVTDPFSYSKPTRGAKPSELSPRPESQTAAPSLRDEQTLQEFLRSPQHDSLFSSPSSQLPLNAGSPSAQPSASTAPGSGIPFNTTSAFRARLQEASQAFEPSSDNFLGARSNSPVVDLTSTTPAASMPRRSSLKRRRSSLDEGEPSSSHKHEKRSAGAVPNAPEKPESIEQVDLQNIEDDSDLSTLLKKQREEQVNALRQDSSDGEARRISGIQCIICLEPPKNLTSTNCGHLFCHTCLMEALIAGEGTQSRCPVCRSSVRRERKHGKGDVGWQALELKFAKRKRNDKGKAPAKS